VVSTSNGVEGIDDIDLCYSVCIADTTQSFENGILQLLNSPDALTSASLSFAEPRFSGQSAYSRLRAVLDATCRSK